MKTKHLVSMVSFLVFSIIAVVITINLKRNSYADNSKVVENNSYDFLIYNTESSLEDCFNKLVSEYTTVSGIVPAVINKDSELLYNFNANSVPDVFMVKTFDEIKVQVQYGNIMDFLNASEKTFQECTKNIPEVIRARINNINNCGIPLTINGVGWAVNQRLLANIFGEDSYKNVINDLITCSYNDFEDFVKNIKSSSVTLNGKTYSIKNPPSIESIFSFPVDFSVAKLLNTSLASVFETPSDLSHSENLSNMSGKFSNWLCMLDLVTSKSSIGRGPNFVSLDKNSRSRAIKEFVLGKSLFLFADSADFNEINEYNAELASHLTFIPVKIPIESNENRDLNTNLTVYCPYYLMVNAKSPKAKMAQDFLTWIVSSPVAKKYLLEDAGCVSYDIQDPNTIENTLSRSAINYLQTENVLAPVFQGAKKTWLNSMYQYLTKKYLTVNNWSSVYFNNFDDFCIKKWLY